MIPRVCMSMSVSRKYLECWVAVCLLAVHISDFSPDYHIPFEGSRPTLPRHWLGAPPEPTSKLSHSSCF